MYGTGKFKVFDIKTSYHTSVSDLDPGGLKRAKMKGKTRTKDR
jgi:hypothetical protein